MHSLRGLLKDVADARGGVILFIDEMHMLSEWTAALRIYAAMMPFVSACASI
jgi:ATP-dependent Clp protease ATP-binding subunit ClpA